MSLTNLLVVYAEVLLQYRTKPEKLKVKPLWLSRLLWCEGKIMAHAIRSVEGGKAPNVRTKEGKGVCFPYFVLISH